MKKLCLLALICSSAAFSQAPQLPSDWLTACVYKNSSEISDIELHLNAATDLFHIGNLQPGRQYTVEVVSVLGNTVYGISGVTTEVDINIGDWAKGMYFVQFIDDAGNATVKKIAVE